MSAEGFKLGPELGPTKSLRIEPELPEGDKIDIEFPFEVLTHLYFHLVDFP
jgi:hypothetical protein